MKDKNNGPTHSQIIGIIWLSIALLLIAVAIFFSRSQSGGEHKNSIADSTVEAVLLQKEDSLYHSRRGNTAKHSQTAFSSHKTSYADRQRQPDSSHCNTTAAPARRQPLTVELNSADTLTLQLLHGIGPAYARRIVKYRERLGGFTSMDQLLEVYGFTPELVEHIAPHLTLDTAAVTRIPINSIGLKQLVRHPYIEYYQARDIVVLRNRGTVFRTADDLRAVPSMADSTLRRLLPYIDFAQ